MAEAVLIPVKAFAAAKLRLATALGPAQREALSRRLAAGVVRAAAPLPVLVVCDDDDVRRWALDLGADVAFTPGLGLDGAVSAGVDRLAAEGVDRVVVAHADLPRPQALPTLVAEGPPGALVLVPDRRRDGTNVIVLPARSGFRFAYGPGSFQRHRAEGERLGLPVVVRPDVDLGWDVDVPGDLVGLDEVGRP